MKRDGNQAAAEGEHAAGGGEEGAQPVEFAVDLEPQRAEDMRRGVQTAARTASDGRLHDRGQLGRGADRAALDDRAGDPAGAPLLAQLVDHIGQRGFVVVVDDVGGGALGVGTEPHVERAVVLEGEAALGVVELEAGDAEVAEHAVGVGEAVAVGGGGGVVEPGLLEAAAVAEGLEAAARGFERLGVGVEAEQASVGRGGFEDRGGVSAQSDRGVDVDAVAAHVEHCQGLAGHHRDVSPFGLRGLWLGGHDAASPASCSSSSWS